MIEEIVKTKKNRIIYLILYISSLHPQFHKLLYMLLYKAQGYVWGFSTTIFS